MYLFVYKVSLRDSSYNRLRHRAFHGEAVPGDEKLYAKIPQLFVMNHFLLGAYIGHRVGRKNRVALNDTFTSACI